jgi:hypothetical protein
LWSTNGMCPPTLRAQTTWVTAFALKSVQATAQGKFRIEFFSRPDMSYTVEYRDSLTSGAWLTFATGGTFTATNTVSSFEDTLSSTGQRFYRIKYSMP